MEYFIRQPEQDTPFSEFMLNVDSANNVKL